MPRFNEQLIVSLAKLTTPEKYPLLQSMVKKLELTLFTAVSPSVIQRIDAEGSANPNIINEAVSLLELGDALSAFYAETGGLLSDSVVELIVHTRTRHSRLNTGVTTQLNGNIMQEYFTDTTIESFLYTNPVFVGLYLYIFIQNASS